MTVPFLITGLPRSRTAWLSAACNQQSNVICYHEPIARVERWQDCLKVWQSSPYGHTGISDSSMAMHLSEILRDHQPNTLIVLRDIGEVEASLLKINVPAAAYCCVLQRRMGRAIRHPLVMTIGFDELADPEKVGRCLEWLMPGVHLDWQKLEEICRMNVQADVEMMKAAAVTGDPGLLLGVDVIAEINSFRVVPNEAGVILNSRKEYVS